MTRAAGFYPRQRRAWWLVALVFVMAMGLADQSSRAEPPEPQNVPTFANAPRDAEGRFTNRVGHLGHGTFGVRAPFFLRRVGGTFRSRPGAPARVDSTPGDLGPFSVTWVGHSTLLVRMHGVTLLTDPIWSDTPSPVSFFGPRRFVPPGLALEDLPPIDFVVISHNHYDHLDLPSLQALAERDANTRFLVPLENGELLRAHGVENVEELDWGETAEVGGVRVHCLPAQHWSKRGLGDDNKTLWASWAVVGSARRFYFAGDTGYFDGFAEIGAALGPFDLAAVPIGAYEPAAMMRESHLNPEEAVAAARDLRADKALAIHFGTFDLSDEPLDEPPRRFLDAAGEQGFAEGDVWVFKIGEGRAF